MREGKGRINCLWKHTGNSGKKREKKQRTEASWSLKKAQRSVKGILGGLFLAAALTVLPCADADFTEGTAAASAGAEASPGGKELNLYAQSAVLMDAGTGRILYEKDGKTKRPMASTTKIMTCILAMEEGNPDDLVTVSSYAASMPDVQLNIREGEQYYLKDLLYSLMLESHNDTAVAVAEHIGGTVEKFAELMNQKARDIGCRDTWFVTPNGLDKTGGPDGLPHSTTAEDLARIMRYCINQSPKKEEFIELTRTASHSFSDVEKKRSFYCANHNSFLNMMPEALTGKTGFTGAAGYCYVGAVRDKDRTFIVALLGCGWPPHKTYKWSDMKTLASYALEEYQWKDIFDRGKTIPDVRVADGVEEKTGLFLAAPEDGTLKVLMREGEKAGVQYHYPSEIQAPVEPGTPVGSADYFIDGQLVKSYPICTENKVEKIDFLYCLEKCFGQVFLLSGKRVTETEP